MKLCPTAIALCALSVVLIAVCGIDAFANIEEAVRLPEIAVSRRAVCFKFAQLERCSSLRVPLSLPPHDHARRSHNSTAGSP
jgi:hypothetical protein